MSLLDNEQQRTMDMIQPPIEDSKSIRVMSSVPSNHLDTTPHIYIFKGVLSGVCPVPLQYLKFKDAVFNHVIKIDN